MNRWSEDQCYDLWLAVRFAEHGGIPTCPVCGEVGAYRCESAYRSRAKTNKPYKCGTEEEPPARRRYLKCRRRDCAKQFSATEGTPFANKKLPWRDLIMGIFTFAGEAKMGRAALQLRHASSFSYKTALLFERRLREAIANAQVTGLLDGDVYIDSTHLTALAREPNVRGLKNTDDWRAHAEEQKDRKLILATIRQMMLERITRIAIFRTEGPEAAEWVRRNVSPEARSVNSDAGSAWGSLEYHLSHTGRRKVVVHDDRFVGEDGANTGPNESLHLILKTALKHVYRHGVRYVQDYCDEIAWRVDHCYRSTGERGLMLLSAAASGGPSRWQGYWQWHKRGGRAAVERAQAVAGLVPRYRRPDRIINTRDLMAALGGDEAAAARTGLNIKRWRGGHPTVKVPRF